MNNLFIITVTLAIATAGARAASFAEGVVSYGPGINAGALTNPAAALGAPHPIVGAGSGFDNVFSPFSPHYEPGQIVRVGAGGHLTLQLSRFVMIDRSVGVFEIGVWENVGLADAAFPNGTSGMPASNFGADSAVVEVSEDGAQWFALNNGTPVRFELPGNYFNNAGPYDRSSPANPSLADFGKPFSETVASFDGKTYPQILTVLDGSAGGTWLNLDSAPVAQVGYIRFSGIAAEESLEVDAVAINTSLAGAAVPEPVGTMLLPLGLAVCMARRRERRDGRGDAKQS